MEREELGAAFDDYRWILENAPWSEHVAVIEDRLFTIGKAMLFGEEYSGWFDDRGRGVEVMETLAAHYRASDKADDALRLVGDYFASDEVRAWGEASMSYLRVADEFPDSEWAERCLWLAGHCRLNEALGPRYDRNELLRAEMLLKRSLKDHPRGVAGREPGGPRRCRELAPAELVVADFYAGRHVLPGEIVRLTNAAALYPETEGGKQATQRLLAMASTRPSWPRIPRATPSTRALRAAALGARGGREAPGDSAGRRRPVAGHGRHAVRRLPALTRGAGGLRILPACGLSAGDAHPDDRDTVWVAFRQRNLLPRRAVRAHAEELVNGSSRPGLHLSSKDEAGDPSDGPCPRGDPERAEDPQQDPLASSSAVTVEISVVDAKSGEVLKKRRLTEKGQSVPARGEDLTFARREAFRYLARDIVRELEEEF